MERQKPSYICLCVGCCPIDSSRIGILPLCRSVLIDPILNPNRTKEYNVSIVSSSRVRLLFFAGYEVAKFHLHPKPE